MDQDPNILEVTTDPPPPKPPRRTWDEVVYDRWMPIWRRIRGPFWVIAIIVAFVMAWLFDLIFVNIYPGYAGVIWRRFSGGTDVSRVYGGGLWIVNPFNKLYVYETRLQQRETEFTALSSNGLTLNIRASVRFHPVLKDLPLLHEEVGPEYIERVVIHQTQSVIRKVIGTYTPDQIYGSQGNILQNVVYTALAELRARHIELDDLLIREIRLPDKMANAIENKLEAEQVSLQYDFVLAKERKEAERKQIEAGGILQFQKTIGESLTENYLRLKGIDASLTLAQSPNSKILVFGSGAGGLPLILNAADPLGPTGTASPPAKTAAAGNQSTPPGPAAIPATMPPVPLSPGSDQPSHQ